MTTETLHGMLEFQAEQGRLTSSPIERVAWNFSVKMGQPLVDQLQAVVERIPCEFGVEDDEPCDCVRHQLDRILGTQK